MVSIKNTEPSDASMSAALQAILESYAVGVQKPMRRNTALAGDTFIDQLYIMMDKQISFQEQSLIRQGFILRDQALRAAQNGDLSESILFFQANESFLQRQVLSKEGRLFIQSYYHAGIAYLEYRQNNFDRALEHIQSSLTCDFILETEFGYAIQHLHRLQLIHNMMRIEKRCGHLNEALNLGYQLLNYLERKIPTLSLPGSISWQSGQLVAFTPDLLSSLFIQITLELALLFVENTALCTPEAVIGICNHIQNSKGCTLSPQSHSWLEIKNELIQGNCLTFLHKAADYLAQGRQDVPWLWYAILTDVTIFCSTLNLPEAYAIQQRISKELFAMKGVPKSFLRALKFHCFKLIVEGSK